MKTLLVFFLALSSQAFACSNHPGISHEQWTSAIKDEKNTSGSVKVLSDDFFSSKKGVVGTNDPNPSSERPIRTIRGN